MSDTPTAGGSAAAYRVLSLRLDEDIRAQLEVLAQLQQRSLTEECRLGLEHWVEQSKADPRVLARAEQVRAEIERDAETRRNAITAVLGGASPARPSRGKAAGS
ncbi:MAG TPA: hypothetical protein PKC31_00910 [Candidatus Nanoperiomorbaceae bacterium]|nr:hypothetical protein [Candidatus Nanoperiomorbaceae bacterium]